MTTVEERLKSAALLGENFELDGVIRAAYIVSHLDKFLRIIEQAEFVHNSLPKEMRAVFADVEQDSLSDEAMCILAYQIARFSPTLTSAMKQMFHEIRSYVGVWVDDPATPDCDPKLFGMLDPSDMKVIEEMVTFVQKLGRKSVRQLLQFLETANDGDFSVLVMQSKGRDSEIRVRYHLSDDAYREFDLN